MADCRRPEVDTDVTSYRKVEGGEVVLETEFGDPSSNRLGALKFLILLRRRRRRRRRGVCYYAPLARALKSTSTANAVKRPRHLSIHSINSFPTPDTWSLFQIW